MKNSNISEKDLTDYERLDAMTDEDIDFSENPPMTEEMFARAVRLPPLNVREPREELTVKLDRDVAKYYGDMGSQYHGVINFLLRRHMQEQLKKPVQPRARRA